MTGDTARLTHVVDVVIGKQMLAKLMEGSPIALGFDVINSQVRITLDAEARAEITRCDDPPARDGEGGEPTGDPAGGGDDAD